MPTARWKGQTIAEAPPESVVSLEGNVYFPESALSPALLRDSATTTHCPWKGTASYYDVVVDGETNHDAAWTYKRPSDAARNIQGFVAFWRGVEVT